MKKLKFISIIFLIACLSVSVFTACKDNSEQETTTSSSVSETESAEIDTTGMTVYYDENYTYHSIVYRTEKATDAKGEEYTYAVVPTTEFVPITIVTTPKTTRIETTSQSVKVTEAEKTEKTDTTGRNPIVSTEPIKEVSKGISVLTKTSPVMAGNTATITVLGNPNKNYSIEFYEEGSTPSVTSGLETKKSNEEGFVSWTFSVSPLCSEGNKKIIIKEVGSQNYIQTSITIK